MNKKLVFVPYTYEEEHEEYISWTYLTDCHYGDYRTDLIDWRNAEIVKESKEYKSGKACEFPCEDVYGNKATLYLEPTWMGYFGIVSLDDSKTDGREVCIKNSKRM